MKPTILVVDDDPLNREIMLEILEGEFEPILAADGADALEKARHCPDLVLLDIMMPGMSGYEVCRRLRAEPRLAATKIILVSAKATTAERLEGYQAGADDYVTKPFDEDELLAKIRVYLRLRTVEELDAMKGELLSLVAHEIRTPLTGILPGAEILAADAPLDDSERRMWASLVLENGRRLLTLAEDGLLLCRFRDGLVRPDLQRCAFGDLVDEVCRSLASAADDRRVRLAPRVAEIELVGDAVLLRTLARTLVENAILLSEQDRTVDVCLAPDAGGVRFRVQHHGEPLDPADTSPSVDVLKAREIRGVKVGCGLGLALAAAIVGVHGGELQVVGEALATVECRLPAGVPVSVG